MHIRLGCLLLLLLLVSPVAAVDIVVTTTGTIGGAGVTDGDKGDITVSASGTVWTIDTAAVTFAKIQNVTSARLLGRTTAGAGPAEELTATQAKTLLGVTFADVAGSASLAQLPPASRAALALTFVHLGGS
jgi:hypothetical protein